MPKVSRGGAKLSSGGGGREHIEVNIVLIQ